MSEAACRYCGGAKRFQIVSPVSDHAWADCFCQRDLRPDDALLAGIAEAITLIDRHIWQASEPIVDLLKRFAAP